LRALLIFENCQRSPCDAYPHSIVTHLSWITRIQVAGTVHYSQAAALAPSNTSENQKAQVTSMDEVVAGAANAAERKIEGCGKPGLRRWGSFVRQRRGLQPASRCHSDGPLVGALLNVQEILGNAGGRLVRRSWRRLLRRGEERASLFAGSRFEHSELYIGEN
jgi:hypothetical protein